MLFEPGWTFDLRQQTAYSRRLQPPPGGRSYNARTLDSADMLHELLLFAKTYIEVTHFKYRTNSGQFEGNVLQLQVEDFVYGNAALHLNCFNKLSWCLRQIRRRARDKKEARDDKCHM